MIQRHPSPIEDQLDELRDQMWQEAKGDEQKYVDMIKQLAAEAVRKYGVSAPQTNAESA